MGLRPRKEKSLAMNAVNVLAKIAILIALVVGTYTFLRHNAAEPVRQVCAKYEPGANFTLENFAKEVRAQGIASASIGDEKEMYSLDNKDAIGKFGGKAVTGRASVTSLFGSRRFTCELYLENGKVVELGTKWWD